MQIFCHELVKIKGLKCTHTHTFISHTVLFIFLHICLTLDPHTKCNIREEEHEETQNSYASPISPN